MSSMRSSDNYFSFVLFLSNGEVSCSLNASRRTKETKWHGKVVGNRKVLDTSVLLDK